MQKEKENLLKQRGIVLWMTGLSGAGKSTIANALEQKLIEEGRYAIVLDGDQLREGLNSDLGFSEKDRKENIRRTAEVARMFAANGAIVITSLITPFNELRSLARSLNQGNYFDIYIKASLEACEKRDIKGLYRKARNGELAMFTGISSPFEEPLSPDLVLDTENQDIGECLEQLSSFIETKIRWT